jgi:hypothetical protein
MRYLLNDQFGRELDESEVLRINYILKRRATSYIAAANEDWLYPERILGVVDWAKLDDDWFLFPNPWKVRFTSGVMAGFKDGSSFAMDEYGRRPGQKDYDDKARRQQESRTFDAAQRTWATKRRGKSVAKVDNTMGNDSVGDSLM